MRTAGEWRVIRSANDPKFMVKGYELADCLYGKNSRFRIAETRALLGGCDQICGVVYKVFDAQTVSDAEVKAGISPRCIGVFPTFDDAKKCCEAL